MSKINILGVKIDNVTMEEALKKVEEMLDDGKKHQVATTNPEFVMQAQKDGEFRQILNKADLSIPDGVGILVAAKYLSMETTSIPVLREVQKLLQGFWVGFCLVFYRQKLNIIKEQVTGADLIWRLAKIARRGNYSFYFLGGFPGVAQKAREKLWCLLGTKLKLLGAEEGRIVGLDVNDDQSIDREIISRINKVQPDILLVAFGAPKQEKWIERNLSQLAVKVVIGVGGTLDYLIEKPRRAPNFLKDRGLEWFWRFVSQPWRVRRVIVAFLKFPLAVAWYKLKML